MTIDVKLASIRKLKFMDNIDLFKCPVCGQEMKFHNYNTLTCIDNHSFDLAKKGYVNLLLNSVKTEYGKQMFESRKVVSDKGFFDTMIDRVSNMLAEEISKMLFTDVKILDAGCGEGTHLAQVLKNLKKRTCVNLQGIGLDISKEGIQIAAKNYHEIIWCVADLARIPVRDRQFNIVLNILSPANYKEFNRILRDDGILVKVVPGSSYLKELRNIFYEDDKKAYSNEEVINHLANNFNILDIHDVSYEFEINKEEELESIIKMTPLSWGVTKERILKAFNEINKITVDLQIVFGSRVATKP
ncbi:MAG: hypothetical protein APF76_01315 [Desulfitibacter sp. BRH_c19]|nr:MAG: hypothetical protein APF76_01315 [Desulfitibacter sp. BRH_c19]